MGGRVVCFVVFVVCVAFPPGGARQRDHHSCRLCYERRGWRKKEENGERGSAVPGWRAVRRCIESAYAARTANCCGWFECDLGAIWVRVAFVLFCCLLKDVLFVLVGSEPVCCSGLFVYLAYVFCFACRFSSGRARPSNSCVMLYSSFLRLEVVCLPLFGLSLATLFVILFVVFAPRNIYQVYTYYIHL